MFPLAFDLASPAMLGWLAAAAAPLLIHLWSRRRYREMPWAAMEYLLAAIKASRRKFTIEQWLLLAIRTLVIVLVVLAVAEPFLAGGPLAFTPGERTLRVLVLDGSYSMAYKPGETSRFEAAKALAAEIVDQSPQGDGFALVLMSSPPRVVVGTPVFEPTDFLPALESLALEHTSVDLSATLAGVEQLVSQARREHPGLRRHEVYFLTDLCRVGWAVDRRQRPAEPPGQPPLAAPTGSDHATADQLLRRAERLAGIAAVTVLDVGQSDAENAAATGLRTAAAFVTVGESVDLEAELKNFGRTPRNRQLVELAVDGRRVRQQQVDLPAGGEASLVFSYPFETAGDHAVEVRLAGDQLDVDDRRYLAVPVKEAVQVLCVDGRPSGRPFGGAADFLAYALSPQYGSGRLGRIRAHVVPETAILELDLAPYDALFLADVAQFTSSEAGVLESYARRGGSTVFFLGPQVLAHRYNEELTAEGTGGVDLLPARLGPLVDQPQFRLDPLGYEHPIASAFRGHERSGLLTTPVRKHYKLLVPDDSSSKVALATSNRDPLVVERPLGRGRVVLVATSADVSWTPMPMWPSYVPIVQEILAFAVADELGERNLTVGQALADSEARLSGDAAVTIGLPDGRSEPLELRNEGDAAAWSYADTSASGFYAVETGPPVDGSKFFAVNVDTAESDLARISPEELREEIWPGVPFEYRTTWEQPEATPAGASIRTSSLAKTLLYAVLALLFVETFLARRFGYHGT